MKIYILIIIQLVASNVCLSQDWEPIGSGFVAQGIGRIADVKVSPIDGDLYVAGYLISTGDELDVSGFTRWDRLTNSWDTTYHIWSYDFGFYHDSLYVNGLRLEGGEFYESLFWRVGDEWVRDSLGPNGETVFNSAIIDDKMYIVGGFDLVGTEPTNGIAIYDGEQFSPYYAGAYPYVERWDDIVKFQGDIYLDGKTIFGYPASNFSGLAKLSDGDFGVVHEEFTGVFFQMWLYSLEVYQNRLYIGGLFHTEQGFTSNGIQSFDGEDMYDLSGGVNGTVHDMKVYEGELYVAGSFTRIGEGVVWWQNSGGQECYGLAKWNGESWTCLNDDYLDKRIDVIEIYNDTIYIGGRFTEIAGDTNMSMIARKRIYPDTTLVNITDHTLSGLQIYPNPSQGNITIDFGETVQKQGNITIYNTMGQQVQNVPIAVGWREYQLETTELPPGIYVVDIHLGEARMTERMVLE